ncbi:UDP-N-acetylglucosamine 2-epimerase (non-hydrolyzing) [Candidatus Woesearchaeota archaeon]|nr:UDP-N-acetylglucosamine 2-epimerase (non-hydrolyzing) [Candidatus Woesearchaeota archaeon]
MKVLHVVGTRPNFMKIAPLYEEFKKYKNVKQVLVHTGQHHDKNMSKVFFEELKLPKPDIYLGVESGTRIHEHAAIMDRFEKVLDKEKPDVVIVVGDVTSTFSCAEVAKDHQIPIAHVEAGLRCYDETMPEEVNRTLTDKISSFLFVTERDAVDNLLKENIKRDRIYFVGNVMIDTLLKHKKKAEKLDIISGFGLEKKNYVVLTMHRPRNVDIKVNFTNILDALHEVSEQTKIIYPIHPRAKKMAKKFNLFRKMKGIILTEQLGYLEFLNLVANSKFIITDSGGLEEETTVLKIPCLTLRDVTERPATISEGTNILVGNNKNKIIRETNKLIKKKTKKGKTPKFWDGKAAKRIVKILIKEFKK